MAAERAVGGTGGSSHWWSSGLSLYTTGLDVLEGGKLTSKNVAGSSNDPLQSFVVGSGAVSKPGGDAAS